MVEDNITRRPKNAKVQTLQKGKFKRKEDRVFETTRVTPLLYFSPMQYNYQTPHLNNRTRKRRLWIFLFRSVHHLGLCYWCERKLKFESSTFDHNPPISNPNSDPDRGVISCESCNHSQVNRKLNYPPTPNYLEAMAEQRKIDQQRHRSNEKSIESMWEGKNF